MWLTYPALLGGWFWGACAAAFFNTDNIWLMSICGKMGGGCCRLGGGGPPMGPGPGIGPGPPIGGGPPMGAGPMPGPPGMPMPGGGILRLGGGWFNGGITEGGGRFKGPLCWLRDFSSSWMFFWGGGPPGIGFWLPWRRLPSSSSLEYQLSSSPKTKT